MHWRAALQHVFKVHRWRGVTIYRSQCPFTGARTSLPEPDGSDCEQWKRDTLAYLNAHPEIGTIFVSGNTGAGVVVPAGQNRFEVKTAGYMTAWGWTPGVDPPHPRPARPAAQPRDDRRLRRARDRAA